MNCYVCTAADGIGKAFAFEFARKGLNVFLISRTESKLKDVQAEIQKAYPKVKVDILGECILHMLAICV